MVTSSSGSAAEGAKDIWKRNAALAFGLLLCGRIHTQLIRLIEDALHWTENLEEGSVTGITHGLSSPVSGLTQRKLQNARGPRTGSRSRLRRPARQLVTQAMRVWSVSDIHSDYKENLAWIENLSLDEYQDDTLIVAGDVSDSPDVIRQSLKLFCERWREVFYVFGNHELWVRGKERDDIDSLGKIGLIQNICCELGVRIKPALVDGVWIVPILSWYHSSFDREPDVPDAQDISKVMTDFHVCRWPDNLAQESIAERIDQLNDQPFADLDAQLALQESSCPIISFSHFLPRQDLLPEKRMLFQPNLAKAVGSDYVLKRIQHLQPIAHVFGHTHFLWDQTLDGIRYCQWPLGYPRERRKRPGGGDGWLPLMLYDTESGLSKRQAAYWSDFYDLSERDPSNVEPASWVKSAGSRFPAS